MSELRPPRTVKDLMAVTGLSRPTVCAAIRTGELPGAKVGAKYVIPADAFDAFCNGTWQPRLRPLLGAPAKPRTATADDAPADLPQPSDFVKRRQCA